MNSDGTIGLDLDKTYVLGTDYTETKVMHVKLDSPHKFIFENA